jgi:hypothetical protein
MQHFDNPGDPVLESDPGRELAEEFCETLKIDRRPGEFIVRYVGTILEDHPSPTENAQARGHRTVRLYRIFESRIRDAFLTNRLMMTAEKYTDDHLRERAAKDGRMPS